MSMSSTSNSIVSKKFVFWNVINDTVKSLLPAFALALQFEVSKWQGQAIKFHGQGLTSLESHTEARRAGGSWGGDSESSLHQLAGPGSAVSSHSGEKIEIEMDHTLNIL